MKMKIDQIHLDPENPRPKADTKSEALAELMSSMEEVGQLQPILVRPDETDATKWVVVAGARRLHAAAELGWQEIDVQKFIGEGLDYRHARFIENEQRKDIHPLDQAKEIQRLLPLHSSVRELADRLGKPPHAIRFLAECNSLSPEIVDLWKEDRLYIGHVRLLMEVKDDERRTAFAEDWAGDDWQGPRSLRSCKDELKRMTLLLKAAPFDLSNEELPGGACTSCPHNTGNDTHLFVELSDQARCVKEECWTEKTRVAVELQTEELREAGETVLDPDRARRECMSTGLAFGSRYVDLNETLGNYLHDKEKGRGKLATIAKEQKLDTIHIVNPHTGAIHHCALRTEIDDALVKAKKVSDKEAQDLGLSGSANTAARVKEEKSEKKRLTRNRIAMLAFISEVGGSKVEPNINVMQWCVMQFGRDAQERVAKQHGLDTKSDYDFDRKLSQLIDTEETGWVILTQLFIASQWVSLATGGQIRQAVKDLAKEWGFDLTKAGKA